MLLYICAQIENSAEEFALYIVHTSGGEAAGRAQHWDDQAWWWLWWCKLVLFSLQKNRS